MVYIFILSVCRYSGIATRNSLLQIQWYCNKELIVTDTVVLQQGIHCYRYSGTATRNSLLQIQWYCNKELTVTALELHFHLVITGSFETITKPLSTTNQLSSGLWLQTRDHPSLFPAKYVLEMFNCALFCCIYCYFMLSEFILFGDM
jgi:hypothetical protein